MGTSEAVTGQAAGETAVFHWKGCVKRYKGCSRRPQKEQRQKVKGAAGDPTKGGDTGGQDTAGHHERAEIHWEKTH